MTRWKGFSPCEMRRKAALVSKTEEKLDRLSHNIDQHNAASSSEISSTALQGLHTRVEEVSASLNAVLAEHDKVISAELQKIS